MHYMLLTYGVCAHCNQRLNGYFEADHIIELWEGGTNDFDNWQPLCSPCHKIKTKLKTSERAEVKLIAGITGQKARRDKNGSKFENNREFQSKTSFSDKESSWNDRDFSKGNKWKK